MTERYYIDADNPRVGDTLSLDDAESHHLAKVMRVGVGATVRVFGAGREFEATVLSLRPQVVVRLEQEISTLPTCRVQLLVAIPWLRGGKTEFLAQKLTELGVSEIAIFLSQRCVAKGDENKLRRLERVVIEACKQCERADVPRIQSFLAVDDLVTYAARRTKHVIVLAERTCAAPLSETVRNILALARQSNEKPHVALISGPEGGFSSEEMILLTHRATPASLGQRILRADFAPLVSAIVVLTEAGEL
jgi:16S rRNA (uracil1498-N3)-methyltransferase